MSRPPPSSPPQHLRQHDLHPLSKVQTADGGASKAATNGDIDPFSRHQRLKVLLVEDDMHDALLIRSALQDCDETPILIDHAQTLADALEKMQQTSPNVVLLDLSLPDSFGPQTISRILKADPLLPIVVTTGDSDPNTIRQALEMGAQDYLIKGEAPGPMIVRAMRYAINRMQAQMERQHLITRLEQEQAALQREMSAAFAMQMDLLPKGDDLEHRLQHLGLRVDSYFQTSSALGGDLWGCIPADGPQMGFWLLDFSGHGVRAALNVFRIQALIRERGPMIADPASMLTSLNKQLRGLLRRGQYATMWLGVIDLERQTLTWSAAGHPPPLLLRPGQPAEVLESNGVPLGLLDSNIYFNRETPFLAQTSLFLASDGLTEAITNHNQQLGDEGLLHLITTSRRDDNSIDLPHFLDQFFAQAVPPLADDLTIVSICR